VLLTIKGVLLIIKSELLIKRVCCSLLDHLFTVAVGCFCETPESRTSEDESDALPAKVDPQKFGAD
jgi:hypothetical protein